jgi:hypothetical protein
MPEGNQPRLTPPVPGRAVNPRGRRREDLDRAGQPRESLSTGEAFDPNVLADIHPFPEALHLLLRTATRAVRPRQHPILTDRRFDSFRVAGPPDPGRLRTEEGLERVFPCLDVLRLMRRSGGQMPGAGALVDIVVWAETPDAQTA